ncbi:MAG TPA: tRNA-dihydrouridine synthase family protein [Candidatus Paceibacterota bacterium]|nr:tRNA-dihydrouridine synthase family protein [Candidatus Paceibacterota bacterium]
MDTANKNFWIRLPRPIMALAPMANVTDEAFRRMFVECGKPDIFWTEFVSVEGLLSVGRERLLSDLWFSPGEHPIVAQIFGSKPEQFEAIGPLIKELGFDGIDINMGCPDRGVEKSGAGAALIKTPELAKKIIRSLKKGAGGLPVSAKTRLGYHDTAEFAEWMSTLLEEDLVALTIHLRTRAEMSDVPAHWDLAPKIVVLRDRIAPKTILLGNGDVRSLEDARQKVEKSGMDGVMVGSGAFGNPWFFSGRTPDFRERLERLVTHTELFEKLYRSDNPKAISQGGRLKNFEVMKKHYKSYTTWGGNDLGSAAHSSQLHNAKELRLHLMEASNAGEVRQIVQDFLKKS